MSAQINKTAKNIFKVVISNLLMLGLGFAINIVLPIFIPVADYGYFQKYILYASYFGIAMFGFNDGINLLYAQYTEKTINKKMIRTFFLYAVIWLTILAVLAEIIVIFIPIGGHERLIFFVLPIAFLINNLNGFFIHVNQILERFTLYSIGQILGRLSFVAAMIFLLLGNIHAYYAFIIMDLGSSFILLIFNCLSSRKYAFGSVMIKEAARPAVSCVKSGIFVMFAALASMLLTSYPRLIIEKFFSIESFSYFSFANSLLSLVLQILLAVGTVMYPIIRKMKIDQLEVTKNMMSKVIFYFGIASMLGYYFIFLFVKIFVQKYIPILEYLFILFPLIIFQVKNSIVSYTYLKALRREKLMFVFTLISLASGISITLATYFIFKSIIAVVISSTIAFILSSYCMTILVNKIGSWKTKWYDVSEIPFVLIFLALHFTNNIYASAITYFIVVLTFFIIKRKDIKELLQIIMKKKVNSKNNDNVQDKEKEIESDK